MCALPAQPLRLGAAPAHWHPGLCEEPRVAGNCRRLSSRRPASFRKPGPAAAPPQGFPAAGRWGRAEGVRAAEGTAPPAFPLSRLRGGRWGRLSR